MVRHSLVCLLLLAAAGQARATWAEAMFDELVAVNLRGAFLEVASDALGATAGGGAALGVSLAFSQKSSQITAAILTSSNISGFTAIALTAT